MSGQSEPSRPPYPWAWFVALVVAGAATGVGFGISPELGIALACLTVILIGWFVVWAARQGRRRRAAGERPDLGDVQRRIRKLAKWGIVLAVLTVLTSAVAITTDDGQTPVWVLVTSPVLVTAGVALLCLFAWFLLPRLRAKQASESE
ncbi:MAG: hypothetical protein ABI873_19030 [Marmoricola sp.]